MKFISVSLSIFLLSTSLIGSTKGDDATPNHSLRRVAREDDDRHLQKSGSYPTFTTVADNSPAEKSPTNTNTPPSRTTNERIPNQYIVSLRDGVDPKGKANAVAKMGGGSVIKVYEKAINGFALNLPEQAVEALLGDIKEDSDVTRIEPNYVVTATAVTQQEGAPWGLAKIDAPGARDSVFTYNTDIQGQGVHVYILDTGINPDHVDFGDRIAEGYNDEGIKGKKNSPSWTDGNGHGTHVASTAAGTTYGIAKKATIHAVRVLGNNGSGSLSGILAGMEWVINNCAKNFQGSSKKQCVANMSLGTSSTVESLNEAAGRMVNEGGIVLTIAAGNDNADACGVSPNHPDAIVVGAVGDSTTNPRASYSNFGTCVHIFAPGSSITAAWYTSTSETSTISGTSMAAPHVAGVAALVVQQKGSSETDASAKNTILTQSESGVVGNAGPGSPNLLVLTPSPNPCTDATDCDDNDPCTTDACVNSVCQNAFDSNLCSLPPSSAPVEECASNDSECDTLCKVNCSGTDPSDIFSSERVCKGNSRCTCYCATCSGTAISC